MTTQKKTREEKFENKKRVSIHTKHQTFKKSVVVVVVVVVCRCCIFLSRAEGSTDDAILLDALTGSRFCVVFLFRTRAH